MRVLSDHISGRHKADTLIMSLFITLITDIILPDQDEAMRDTKQTICSSYWLFEARTFYKLKAAFMTL